MSETITPIPRRRVTHRGGGKQMTVQADALETDINAIVKRWVTQGTPAPGANQNPAYGDFASAPDYQQALNQVMAAQADFEALPAHVRKHVENDPAKFLDLVFDAERKDELLELGLLEELLPPAVRIVGPLTVEGQAPDQVEPGEGSSPAPTE